MIPVTRRQIWLARLPEETVGREQTGTRPVLIISNTDFNNSGAGLVIAVPLTRSDRKISSHVPVRRPEGGLKDDSFIMCEQVRNISNKRLVEPWGSVSEEIMSRVEEIISVLLDLS